MAEVARIYIKRGSGMTSAALALATGLESAGQHVQLIVPTMSDVKIIHPGIFGGLILPADDIRSLMRALPGIYIFDDALRCAEEFRKHREGELLIIARDRLDIFRDSSTRIYLFQHTI